MAYTVKQERSPRAVLLGASPDTGNLGVTALCVSTLNGLAARGIRDWTIFDFHTQGYRKLDLPGLPEGQYRLTGSSNSRRYYRSNNLWRQWHLAPCWPFTNPALRAFRRADVVMSLAGGDSFTDLYGPKRFETVTRGMRIATESIKRPLIMLPQTYGPFRDPKLTGIAADIIKKSTLAWARDEESYHLMHRLAGEQFVPDRHMLGVDMAFSLPIMKPDEQQQANVEQLIGKGVEPVVGFNVSGLLYNDPVAAFQQYGLRADYEEVVTNFLLRLLTRTRAKLILVSHVITPPGHYESDIDACRKLKLVLSRELMKLDRKVDVSRVLVAEALDHPSKVKWLIKQCDWFCGTRMHSTIAALSSRTACAAIAYSKKTYGVFAQCGVGSQVADPRQQETKGVIEQLWQSWENRAQIRKRLELSIPAMTAQCDAQLDRIADFCQRNRR